VNHFNDVCSCYVICINGNILGLKQTTSNYFIVKLVLASVHPTNPNDLLLFEYRMFALLRNFFSQFLADFDV
jgi:hypothetical protein